MRGAHSRVVLLSLFVAFGATSFPACKKKLDAGQEAAARQSLEEIKVQLGKVQKATAEVRARFNVLPEDLPGLEPVRSKLLAVEEVLGVENGRVQWLSGELDAAVASGNQEQFQKVTDTIRGFVEGSKGLGKPLVELTHELLPFERLAAPYLALVKAGRVFMHTLPTGFQIRAAKDGIENQLVDFIADGKKQVDKKTWFAFDRISFSGDGALPDFEQSNDQIQNVVAILKAYPQVKLEIGGFTDNKGPAAANKKLSAARAEGVKKLLVLAGVDEPRLAAQGYGPANPVCAANDTEECRAKNRRIGVRVTAK
jgi:outer membrane protein OmpA-like peptidoglycan-associated protein